MGSTRSGRNHRQDSPSQGGLAMAPLRHCELSEAIHLAPQRKNGLLRRFAPRNDEGAAR
jgi:hypothetical protein